MNTPIKKFEKERFEFVLYINNNIICQRYLGINDFNEQSVKSEEMKELMDSIVGMNNGYGFMGLIPEFFKSKSEDYLWNNYKKYNYPQGAVETKNLFEKEDMFQFEIKVDGKSVAKSQFSGNFFPTEVRYNVDIRELIPEIKDRMRSYLSLKKFKKRYADKAL